MRSRRSAAAAAAAGPSSPARQSSRSAAARNAVAPREEEVAASPNIEEEEEQNDSADVADQTMATAADDGKAEEIPAADDEDADAYVGEEGDGDADDDDGAVTGGGVGSYASRNYVLVADHGQTSLVQKSQASKYRRLATEADDPSGGAGAISGASTPKPKFLTAMIKRGRGRPRKYGAKQHFEFVGGDASGMESEGLADESATAAAAGDGDESSAVPEEDEEEAAAAAATDKGGAAGGAGTSVEAHPDGMQVWIEGNQYTLVDDEIMMPDEAVGEAKVDRKGKLLGDREYTFPIFTSPRRPDPEKQYALSIDVARGAGLPSSFFLYRRNITLVKLSCTDAEKEWLVENGRLPSHLRTRSVNMLAVRNVYKIFGARVIRNGKHVVDDYYESVARQAGKVEGRIVEGTTMSDEQAQRISERKLQQQARGTGGAAATGAAADNERLGDRLRRRADAFTHAGTDLYGNSTFTTFGCSGESPFDRVKAWPTRRTNILRQEIDEETWMLEMARSVRGMNREILVGHRERWQAFPRPFEITEQTLQQRDEQKANGGDAMQLDEDDDDDGDVKAAKKYKLDTEDLPIGVYEPMSNCAHYPSSTQPTRAMLERIAERPQLSAYQDENNGAKRKRAILGGQKVGHLAWGLASIEQRVRLPNAAAHAAADVLVEARAALQEEEPDIVIDEGVVDDSM